MACVKLVSVLVTKLQVLAV